MTLEYTSIPFGKNIADDDLFQYSQLQELSRLLVLTAEHRSILLATGQSGVGKTTAIRAAIGLLPTNKYSVIYLGQDQHGCNLMRRFASRLGLQPKRYRQHVIMQIDQFLSDNLMEKGKTPLVVVDEAHLLDDATLEDLRLMTNANFDKTSPVAMVLLGQLPLRAKLKSAGLEALSQRLRFRYALEGFTEDETAAYIKHHLALAGLPSDLFSPDAIRQIFLASRGIPREINNCAIAGFLKAQTDGLPCIDIKVMRKVLAQRDLN